MRRADLRKEEHAALVAEDGAEWYRSLGCADPVPWVAENVMPVIKRRRSTIEQVQRSLSLWLQRYDRVHVIASWPADFTHFTSLLETRPGFRLVTPPLTMELVDHVEPESLLPHNALADALALRAAHLASEDAAAVG